MRDDGPLSTEALVVLRHATVADLRSDVAELSALVAAIRRPFPATLPTDPDEREFALLLIALRARDHARRLLALVEAGM
ncbi:acyl-CoA reductase-like NAD-dependent aldehyde dehydrogenase [Bradyrhizobium huanghuaihaiense]